ncbi:SRPBCC family protein [Microbacterium paludicola]|uniref:SRPBCC family protein n=1 Tax=Microbacterium paludicola TaxID=300019 RepID=UPI0011A004AB|nr:SRPBCC family protein [Microbacterium paludicola]
MTITGRFDEGRRTVRLVREFTTSIDDVWASIVDSERLSRWFGTWSGDPASGSISVTMNAEPETLQAAPWTIRRCEPPHVLSVSITDDYGSWHLTAELTARDGRTVLALTQHEVAAEMLPDTGPGWEWYLDRLVAVVDGGSMPSLAEFEAVYAPMSGEYTALARSAD